MDANNKVQIRIFVSFVPLICHLNVISKAAGRKALHNGGKLQCSQIIHQMAPFPSGSQYFHGEWV